MIKRYAVYSVGTRFCIEGKPFSNSVEILDYKRACNLLNDVVLKWKEQGCVLEGLNVWIETKQTERKYYSEPFEV